mgnify:CR=1 FL=1|jgi:hypothetical protein
MLDAILGGLTIVEIFITLGLVLYVVVETDNLDKDRYNFILTALWNFIKGLFVNKNWFGIILGLIIFIFAIPAILILLFGELVMWLVVLVVMIWDLGNKKSNRNSILSPFERRRDDIHISEKAKW